MVGSQGLHLDQSIKILTEINNDYPEILGG